MSSSWAYDASGEPTGALLPDSPFTAEQMEAAAKNCSLTLTHVEALNSSHMEVMMRL